MTYGEISKGKIANFPIPLPPLEVQQRIVRAIESLEKKAQTYVIKDLVEQKQQILLDGIK